jgi:chaperonin GroES
MPINHFGSYQWFYHEHLEARECQQFTDATSQSSIRSIRALVPLLDRVLVQRVKAEAKTASGIFLPESSVEKLNEAKVLAVGPGGLDRDGKRVPMGVAVGDRVLIPQVWIWNLDLSWR